MLYLIIANLMLAVNFIVNKQYQKLFGTHAGVVVKYNFYIAVFTVLLFFILNRFNLSTNRFSCIMGAISGLLTMIYTCFGFHIIQQEKMALYTMFLMSGGMVLPYIWGCFFLNEEFSWLRTVGIILIIVSLILSNADTKQIQLKTIIGCVAVFLLNGCTSIVSKIHQITPNAVSANDFVILSNIAKAIFCVPLLFVYKDTNHKKFLPKCAVFPFIYIFLAAMTSGFSYLLQLISAEKIPATILYPFITGGTVVLTAIMGYVFFQEKITGKLFAGLFLCSCGTFIFMFL